MDRKSVAELGTLPLGELYQLHADHDLQVKEIRSYHADIDAVICAKEKAAERPGSPELAQKFLPGPDLIDQVKALPAEVRKRLKEFFTGEES